MLCAEAERERERERLAEALLELPWAETHLGLDT
jgi:hypothetical protein